VKLRKKKYGTHTYTGPRTLWGLNTGTRCRVIGSRAGGKRIQTEDGKCYIVGVNHLRAATRRWPMHRIGHITGQIASHMGLLVHERGDGGLPGG
jgi:hypothetical protein